MLLGLIGAGAAPLLGAAPKAAAQDEDAMLRRLGRVGGRIETAVRQSYPKFRKGGRHLTFGLASDGNADAVCLPEGRITITTGFMQALAKRPDDELAAVLGHEATHLAQRHHAQRRDPLSLGDVIEAVRGDAPDQSQQAGGRGSSTLAEVRYSRDDEYRADAGSVKLLQAAGYDTGAMSGVLKMLNQRDETASAKAPGIGWLANHPEAEKRIESADRAAAALAQAGPRARP